jgi:transcriptional regulator with XRE-family HTH domain
MVLKVRVGEEMARIRKGKKMTQAELAAVVGVSQRMIAAIEGDERRPSADLAQRIGAELGFPWTVFFDQTVADEYRWT